jgi:hypothetical protein
MTKYTRFSACAGLAALGAWFRQKGIWTVVEGMVEIKQKVIKDTPLDKLLDAFINMLAGGQGNVEVNTRVRPDVGLQRAFGRDRCAEQSVVSETLNCCEEETVEQMRRAIQRVFQQHSRAFQHDYDAQCLVLDLDTSGMPAGRQGEGVSKGYFAESKNKRGRQLGRVIATLYDEIVEEQLYSGKRQLDKSVIALVEAAGASLHLTPERRSRCIVRMDAGGGTVENVNWLLNADYQLLAKVKHWKQAAKLARSVAVWYPDPKIAGREVGWVEAPYPFDKPTRQLAIRSLNRDGEWSYHALVFTLTNEQFFWLARQPVLSQPTTDQLLFTLLAAYDLRNGGIETSYKNSKQGLGFTRRNKRQFTAQEMLILLAQLAYNLLTWFHVSLSTVSQRFRSYGAMRLIRDLLHIPGLIELDGQGHILQIGLSRQHPYASFLAQALVSDDLPLILGEI